MLSSNSNSKATLKYSVFLHLQFISKLYRPFEKNHHCMLYYVQNTIIVNSWYEIRVFDCLKYELDISCEPILSGVKCSIISTSAISYGELLTNFSWELKMLQTNIKPASWISKRFQDACKNPENGIK